MSDRRREARLSNTRSSFVLTGEKGELIPCRVNNVSRRGIGITIDNPMHALSVGKQVTGKLTIDNGTFEVGAVVRVARNSFFGLEFITRDQAFVTTMSRILSPKYIATSIIPLNTSTENTHLEYGFHGEEFEVLAFKTGKSGLKRMLQIFAAGHIVEISGSVARSVPSPLVRRSGSDIDFAFMAEFTNEDEGFETINLREFFTWTNEIILLWPNCPQDFREAIAEQISMHQS